MRPERSGNDGLATTADAVEAWSAGGLAGGTRLDPVAHWPGRQRRLRPASRNTRRRLGAADAISHGPHSLRQLRRAYMVDTSQDRECREGAGAALLLSSAPITRSRTAGRSRPPSCGNVQQPKQSQPLGVYGLQKSAQAEDCVAGQSREPTRGAS